MIASAPGAVSFKDLQALFPKAEGWSLKAIQEDAHTIVLIRRYHKAYTPTTYGKGRRSNVVKDSLREIQLRVKQQFIEPFGPGPYPVEVRSALTGEEFSGPGPNPMYFRHAYAEVRLVIS